MGGRRHHRRVWSAFSASCSFRIVHQPVLEFPAAAAGHPRPRRAHPPRPHPTADSKGSGGGGAIIVVIVAVAPDHAGLADVAGRQTGAVAVARTLADAVSVELTKNPDAMISALRKIENRGELPGATSAVMELCVDNPREGLPTCSRPTPRCNPGGGGGRRAGEIRRRSRPGPLALPSDATGEPDDQPEQPGSEGQSPPPLPQGPWGSTTEPAGAPRRWAQKDLGAGNR